MKILVVCYSLTGRTRSIAKRLAKSLQADFADLFPLKWKSKASAYTVGLFLAQAHKAVEVLPLAEDVASYDCIVVAGPVWGGCPAPMLNGFIRQYHLEGKKSFGLLTCGLDGKSAPKALRRELEEAGTKCRSVITIKSEEGAIDALEKGKIGFIMNEKGKIVLQVNEHNRKKRLSPNQVQAMQELIDASQNVDSQKKEGDKPQAEEDAPVQTAAGTAPEALEAAKTSGGAGAAPAAGNESAGAEHTGPAEPAEPAKAEPALTKEELASDPPSEEAAAGSGTDKAEENHGESNEPPAVDAPEDEPASKKTPPEAAAAGREEAPAEAGAPLNNEKPSGTGPAEEETEDAGADPKNSIKDGPSSGKKQNHKK